MLRSFNKVRYTQSGSDMYYVGGGGIAHYLGPLVVVGWSTVSKGPFPDGLGFWVDSRPTRATSTSRYYLLTPLGTTTVPGIPPGKKLEITPQSLTPSPVSSLPLRLDHD